MTKYHFSYQITNATRVSFCIYKMRKKKLYKMRTFKKYLV